MNGTPRNLILARKALKQGNWLRAVDLLKTELARRPECFECAADLAGIYMDLHHFDLAEQVIDDAFAEGHMDAPETVCPVTPQQRELYRIKANLRLTLGDPRGALSLYTLLLAEHPDDPCLLYQVGLAYHKLGHHEMSIAYMDRAVSAHPDHLPAQEIKGQILMAMGRLNDALEVYMEISLGHPGNVNAYAMMGHLYHHLGRPVAAVSAWERAVSLAPKADEPLRRLACAALREGNAAKARDLLTRAVTANPNNVLAHLDLADLLVQAGETRAALAHWDEAERLAPRHPRLEQVKPHRDDITLQVISGCGPTGLDLQRLLDDTGQEPASS